MSKYYNYQRNTNNQNEQSDLTNPYNFVPFNSSIVSSTGKTDFDSFENGYHSGYIDIQIKPQSHLFIRGNKTEFYKVGDNYAIPGSSIKGMIRTLVEVIAYGNVGFYNKVQNKILDREGKKEVPTNKTVLPPQFKNDKIDFANTMFGNNNPTMGKINFEDAVCITNLKPENFQLSVLNILSSPNPELSSYYKTKDLYGDDNTFKGNKFYWHRDDQILTKKISLKYVGLNAYFKYKKLNLSDYPEIRLLPNPNPEKPPYKCEINVTNLNGKLKDLLSDILFNLDAVDDYKTRKKIEEHGCQNTIANLLLYNPQAPTSFNGRIRYNNLSSEELGILLMALQLQPNCCHHIGMAKPYGMGRIKLDVTKVIQIDRPKRYETVVNSDESWNLSEVILENNEINKFKNAAATYLLTEIKAKTDVKDESVFWRVGRMQDLLALHKTSFIAVPNWTKKTVYQKPVPNKKSKVFKTVKEIRDQIKLEQNK